MSCVDQRLPAGWCVGEFLIPNSGHILLEHHSPFTIPYLLIPGATHCRHLGNHLHYLRFH